MESKPLSIRLALHQQAADQLGGKTCLAGQAKKPWGRCWVGVLAMGRLEEFRAYCGTKHHSQIAATELIDDQEKLPSSNRDRLLAYRLNHTLQHRDCCKHQHILG